jgi:hypothetical protein
VDDVGDVAAAASAPAVPEVPGSREADYEMAQTEAALPVVTQEATLSAIEDLPATGEELPTATLYWPGLDAVSLHRTPSLSAPKLVAAAIRSNTTLFGRRRTAVRCPKSIRPRPRRIANTSTRSRAATIAAIARMVK